jgi:hypothetical protein
VFAFLPQIVGLTFGLTFRRKASRNLNLLIRGQTAGMILPLSLVGGMLFQLKPVNVISMALLVVAVAAGVTIGRSWLVRSGGRIGIASAATVPNAGMWNMPIASVFLGPAAVAYIAVYAMVSQPANLLVTRALRKNAPVRQERKTALVDYAAPFALIVGMALQLAFGRPTGLGHLFVEISLLNAAVNIAMFGLAVPLERPSLHEDAHVLPAAILLRFLPPVALLALMLPFDLHPPAAAWLIAFAPTFFRQLPQAALYGFNRRQSLLVVLATIACSLAATPLIIALA